MGIQNMGIGLLGDPNLIIKRKYRWTMQFVLDSGLGTVGESFCKIGARPNLSFEATELNFLNAKNFIPGKGTYETMSITYIDVANSGQNSLLNLLTWVSSVRDLTDPVTLNMGVAQKDYTAHGYLVLWDGGGSALEEWELLNCWPEAIDFGDLDMSSSDPAEIALTVRYSDMKYKSFCGSFNPGLVSSCGPLSSQGAFTSGIQSGGFNNPF